MSDYSSKILHASKNGGDGKCILNLECGHAYTLLAGDGFTMPGTHRCRICKEEEGVVACLAGKLLELARENVYEEYGGSYIDADFEELSLSLLSQYDITLKEPT